MPHSVTAAKIRPKVFCSTSTRNEPEANANVSQKNSRNVTVVHADLFETTSRSSWLTLIAAVAQRESDARS